ncbi:hypothetical protein Tco_1255038 [Tanacetum coccineum]
MLLLLLRAILYFLPLQMFLKFTCTNYGILSISMKIPTGSEWTKRRNSTSIWKSSETYFRSALEFMVKTLMNFPLMKILCLSFKELGHTREIKTITNIVVDQMHQPWRTFATIINISLSGKTTGLDKLRLSRAHILWAMYYKKNVDYIELLWKDFTYQIKNRGHKNQDKMAYKFKKPASPKLTNVQVLPKEPIRKLKRVKRTAKKSSDASTTGVVIRETPVMSLSKKKEKMTIEKHKGIDLLSKVALTKEARVAKIKPSITNEGTGAKPGVPDVTEEESTESVAESWGRDEDDSNNDQDSRSEGSDQESNSGEDNTQSDKEKGSDSEHETDGNETGFESDQEENEEDVEDDEEEKNYELVKTPSNSTDDEDETNEQSKVEDKAEGDEDKGMDYTTN